MELFFVADDFTGGVDVCLQASRAGQSAVMFLSTDAWEKATPNEMATCTGVATTFRNQHPKDFEVALGGIFDKASRLRPRVVQYKICSTADSSPTRGSIRSALGWMASADARFIVLLVAQPSLRRYTFFSHHFANDRGEVFRLDRQPTMANHPSTPMGEADLRVHFEAQVGESVGQISVEDLGCAEDIRAAVEREIANSRRLILADTIADDDLHRLGSALGGNERLYVIGSGGATQGFGSAIGWPRPNLEREPDAAPPASGPVLVLSGSRSRLTLQQVHRAAVEPGWQAHAWDPTQQTHHVVHQVMNGLAEGSNVLVHTGEATRVDSEQVNRVLAAVGSQSLGAVARLIIAGGDTSGELLTQLGAEALTVLQPVGQTCLCSITRSGGEALEVILKGGQIGDVDFFIRNGRRADQL